MRLAPIEKIAGSTIRTTFVSSGTVPTSISSAILDRNETLVNSTAATALGNGSFFAQHQLPNTPGWYVNEWLAVIQGNTFKERQFIRLRTMETD